MKKIKKKSTSTVKRVRIRKKPEHYVDNKLFLVKMVEYKRECNKAERAKKEKPPVTNYNELEKLNNLPSNQKQRIFFAYSIQT